MPRERRRWGDPPDAGDPTVAGQSGAGPSSVDPAGEGSSYEDMTGAGFEDSGGAGPSSAARTSSGWHDPDTFSPLLWTHHVKHRVSLASLEVRDYT